MKTKRRILPALLLSLFAGATAPAAQAQQFSGVVVFGDSLSDAGYFRPVLQAAGVPASLLPILGRFTTAPGPVWSELMTQYYGFAPAPSNVSGGNIFAQGGARVTANSSSNPTGAAQRSVQTQITEFLARSGGTADPNALYAVWAGNNDVIQTLLGAGAGTIPQGQVSGIIQTTAAAEIGQLARLRAAGARYIIVFGIPNIGATPGFIAAGATTAGTATALSAGYNTALFTGLATAGIRVIPIDSFAFLAEVRANPSAFGFTNITVPACGPFPPFSSQPDAFFCPPNVWLAPNANQTFLFADGIHPTAAAHAIIAQFAESMIDGPFLYSLLAEAPLRTRASHVRTVNDGLASGAQAEMGRLSVFAAVDRGNFNIDTEQGIPGVKSNNKSFSVGVTARISETATLGAAVGRNKSDGGFGRDMGGFNISEDVFSLFGSMKWRGFYGTGIVSISNLEFGTIQRNIVLGPLVRTANARTDGSNASAFFTAGYDLAFGPLMIGPTVSVDSQNVDVNPFDEANAASSNLHIAGQKRRSEVWGAGVRASATVNGWTPWASILVNRERKDDLRLVTANPLSLATGSSYDIPAYSPDNSFRTMSLGVRGDLMDRLGVSLAWSRVTGRSGIRDDGVAGMLSYRF